jgi:hypothetical protein
VREKNLIRKYDTAMKILKHTENAKTDLHDTYNDLEKKWNEMSNEYHKNKVLI